MDTSDWSKPSGVNVQSGVLSRTIETSGNFHVQGVVKGNMRSLLVACCVVGLVTACNTNSEGPSLATTEPVTGSSTGVSTSGVPTTGRTPSPDCSNLDGNPPENLSEDLSAWLRETQSDLGEVPEDLGVTIVDAAGESGAWVFVATFDSRFEAGIFALTGDGDFQALWGGVASSDTEIRDWITSNAPAVPISLTECIEVSGFVEG
ncbi:MAG: hypothetical protein WBM90_00505 [Acidimicrobiia bacterium]